MRRNAHQKSGAIVLDDRVVLFRSDRTDAQGIGTSAGVAFADADLLGIPTIVVVGKGLAAGQIEVKDRRSGERRTIALDGAVAELARLAVPAS